MTGEKDENGRYIRRERYVVPAAEASTWARILSRTISKEI